MSGQESRRLRVLVTGAPEIATRLRAELGGEWDVDARPGLPDAGARADVFVVDTRTDAPARVLEALRTLAAPALVCARPDDLTAVLGGLRDRDEVCGIDEPPALLAFRVRRLARAAALPRDPLTGLATRTAFRERLASVLETASESMPVSVLFVDVDRFKALNDEHGHAAGDEALAALARRLAAVAAAEDLVARGAGNVFFVLSPRAETEAMRLAESLCAAARVEPVLRDVHVTVSIGVATADHVVDARDLLRECDEALYAAKARGRGRAEHHGALEREALERDGDVRLEGFEDFTRVLADRIADTISRRGRRLFQAVREQADVDSLTRLYSRRYLDRRLPFELSLVREGRAVTVALLDIDFFGEVNKAHGWPTGDQVLQEVAELLRGSVRAGDWIARYGGEEVCLVLQGADPQIARAVLERVRTAIETHPFQSTTRARVTVTVSIGAVVLGAGSRSVAGIMDEVSERLLEAKRGGRNRVCL